MLTSRREFVCGAARTLAAGAVVGVTGPWLSSRHAGGREVTTASQAPAAPGQVVVDVSVLTADGGWLVAPSTGPDGAPMLIVRQARTRYLALSMQCTHMGCPVNTPVEGVMTCPCHGSQFGLEGEVRHGPAQYPLGQYQTSYDGATKRLTVTFS